VGGGCGESASEAVIAVAPTLRIVGLGELEVMLEGALLRVWSEHSMVYCEGGKHHRRGEDRDALDFDSSSRHHPEAFFTPNRARCQACFSRPS
jgi:hypothetical protein